MFTRELFDHRPWVLLALVLGCESEPEPAPAVREIAQPVVNGETAAPCQWPSAVMVVLTRGLCSGTLVNPKLVTLAAHCQTAGAVRAIYLGENNRTPARKVDVSKCNFYPDFQANVNDVAYCVLSEPVNDVPIAPVLMGCETSVLEKGKLVNLVGFGITSMQQPTSYGIKRFASVPLLNTPGPTGNIAQVGVSSNGCEGDSGGPIFVQLADGTWRTIGVASTTAVETDGTSTECIAPTNYVLLHRYVRWIESDSGIDITPCHDADGRWNPSADCGRFSTAANTSTGTWDDGCTAPGAVSANPGASCAPAGEDPGGGGPAGTDGGARLDARLPEQAPSGGRPVVGDGGGPAVGSAPSSGWAIPGRPHALPTLGLPAGEGTGCSCHLGRSTPPGGGMLWLPGLAALARRLRRRRK
jgi:MYXO-CTERM domain-containing protein